MKATLTEDCLWRGVLYLAGDREIPDDLAIALNLRPATPVADSPEKPDALQEEAAQTQEAEVDAVHEPSSSPGPVQGTKRRVKRG